MGHHWDFLSLCGALGKGAVGVARLWLVVGLEISSGGLGAGGKLTNPWNYSKIPELGKIKPKNQGHPKPQVSPFPQVAFQICQVKSFIPSVPQFPICALGKWLGQECLENSPKKFVFYPRDSYCAGKQRGELHLSPSQQFPTNTRIAQG